MNTKLMLALSLLLPLAPSAMAAKGVGMIERIYPIETRVNFRLKGDECKRDANNGNTYWYYELSDGAADINTAMLLSAAATGTIIKIGYSSCEPDKSQKIHYLYQDY